MRVLIVGLYTEGRTDQSFLSPLLRRCINDIFAKYDGGQRWDDAAIRSVVPTVRPHETQARKTRRFIWTARENCQLRQALLPLCLPTIPLRFTHFLKIPWYNSTSF
jgi:hypothetical protein